MAERPPSQQPTKNSTDLSIDLASEHEEEPLSPRSRPMLKDDLATAASIQDPKPLNLPPAATPPQVHNTWEEILADRNTPETLAVVDRILPFWRVLRKDELYGHQWKGPDERRGGFSGGSGEGGDHEVLEEFGGKGEDRTEEEEDGRTAGEAMMARWMLDRKVVPNVENEGVEVGDGVE
ncbi:hypothetical protein PRZ48_011846 [Zasmidium cellare]|uniref:Uncharacterized protein n=1 Tax=Zasmidium cellare TaxID=395010 RepID=A0ABR0E829_ZASCE|nr:hypothetical protein PRZ48_011846 [Zasmidium cellare]